MYVKYIYGCFEKHSVDPKETEVQVIPLKSDPRTVNGSTNMKILLSNLIASVESRVDSKF